MTDELTILLVEDDHDTREGLADILRLDGHHIRQAGSFTELRDAGEQSDVQIAIVDCPRGKSKTC